MMQTTSGGRHIALWVQGFESDPDEAAKTLPACNITIFRKGGLSPTGRPYRDSALIYMLGFDGDLTWSEAFEGLLDNLGGMLELEKFMDALNPRERLIQLTIPVRGSPYQENNYFDLNTLRKLGHLGLDLGFEFGTFDPSDPTHLSPRSEHWF